MKWDTFPQSIVSRDPDILTPGVVRVALDFEHRIMIEAMQGKEKDLTPFDFYGAMPMFYIELSLCQASERPHWGKI